MCVCYTGTACLFVWLVKLKCYTLSMQVAGPLLQRQGSIYRGAVLGFLEQLRDTPFPSWRSLQDDLIGWCCCCVGDTCGRSCCKTASRGHAQY